MTVDSLYRCGTPAESEEALRSWLHQRIHEVEAEMSEIEQMAFLAKRAGWVHLSLAAKGMPAQTTRGPDGRGRPSPRV